MKNYIKILLLFLCLSLPAFAEQQVLFLQSNGEYTPDTHHLESLLKQGWKVIHMAVASSTHSYYYTIVIVLEKN